MISVIIIEDQKNVGNVLRRMIETNHSDMKVVAVCPHIKEAEEMINALHPDLVFLDVELGKSQTCFDLLKRFTPINFSIIFTTAYNRIAMQSFKLNAIDYLVKPVDADELGIAIEKFKERRYKIDNDRIESLINTWDNSGNQQNEMYFPTDTDDGHVTIADIIFCEEINGQTALILTNEEKIIINMPLRECEDILTPYQFYKIQKSYLVNLNHVKGYSKWKEATTLLMSNNINLGVSRGLNNKFLTKLKIF